MRVIWVDRQWIDKDDIGLEHTVLTDRIPSQSIADRCRLTRNRFFVLPHGRQLTISEAHHGQRQGPYNFHWTFF